MTLSGRAGGEPIGNLVRRLRTERGYTQAALAKKADCSRSLIQQIENGTRVPPLALRERLSSALGEELPMAAVPDATAEPTGGHYDLRMRFNILLGKDPEVVERVLSIAQSVIDARVAPEDIEPLRLIAARQLDRAEEILAQIPSRSATVWEWNTINDWLTILEQAERSIRAIHTADLGTIGGDVGDDYHSAIVRLADNVHEPKVQVRRMYVLDRIEDVWPYDDKLWRQVRSGVESVLVKREHARNAQSMLVVDDRYVCIGEYDYSRQARVATRFSALKHDVAFAVRRFEKLYELRRMGSAIVVDDIVSTPPLAEFERLTQGNCRALFREALAHAWDGVPAPGETATEAGRS
ncbi:helix-turn-helix domain-containing protein [Nocardia sp. CDC159]|uniref:Helix-turn-helix domain-containing protein n=1 Tax=Nocardia pulmonis TaxID=2951408 RepID=A0A9X2J042_9NOCA|nr:MULTISPECIES: helix-turn-helix transcriptional regulator [Nocardia]MCM6778088.1 helix-turn-helix domain-containing protein [Nocardia pulmonis]MCM6790977.1 helix-turn-helix domain-containing protein [Nocardia sp. CDC159]